MNTRLHRYWSGKSVLISGASSGLGAAVVETLAPYRVNFGLLSRRGDHMQALAKRLGDSGSSFWLQPCDIRNRAAVQTAVRAFVQHAGCVDVCWANSGTTGGTGDGAWDWNDFENIIDTNLKGAVYMIRECLELMKPRKSGTVVGIGSVVSMRGLPRRGAYGMSKAAMAYFFESLAIEHADIQFTYIHPGYVDTPMNAGQPNRFFLMTPDAAAAKMIRAVARRQAVYIYPWQMRGIYRLAQLMPATLYQRLGRNAYRWKNRRTG